MQHSWIKLAAITGIALSGFLLFALELRLAGYSVLAISLLGAFIKDATFGREILLIAVGLVVVSLAPINADIDNEHIISMGPALIAAILLPFFLSKYVYKSDAITFPFHFKERWSKSKWLYIAFVLVASFIILPWYLITFGVYTNWPAADNADTILRLFIGTNVVGIWDELFFICIILSIFRRHIGFWQANILQAVIFSSFLYELGFQSIGPLLTFPFALAQGYVFKRSNSLFYVICVHLLLDFILFLTLIHAHSRDFLPIFLY